MSESLISRTPPPALPIPGDNIDKRYIDSQNNVLRLYFGRVSNAINNVTGHLGGRFLDVANGVFFSTVNQPIATINTGQVVTFNNTYLNHGVSINGVSNSQITVEYSGVYNFQFSAQPTSNSASTKIVYLWIARDGTDIGYTGKQFTVQGSADVHDMVYSFNIDMLAGQYLEMKWSSDDVDTALTAQTASTPHPGVPSAVMTVNLVSALPDTLPTPP
jgi:hypothetical protein